MLFYDGKAKQVVEVIIGFLKSRVPLITLLPAKHGTVHTSGTTSWPWQHALCVVAWRTWECSDQDERYIRGYADVCL